MIVNVFNGDCAFDVWRRNPTPGDFLVWRENYLIGDIPDLRFDAPEYIAARAAALAAGTPGECERRINDIAAELDRMERSFAAAGANDTVVLWFDFCPFDRAMLFSLLWRLDCRPPSARPKVELICRDIDWGGRPDDFRHFAGTGVELTPEDFAEGAEMWAVWRKKHHDNPAAEPDMPHFMRRGLL